MRVWRAVRNTARAATKSRRERLCAGGGGGIFLLAGFRVFWTERRIEPAEKSAALREERPFPDE